MRCSTLSHLAPLALLLLCGCPKQPGEVPAAVGAALLERLPLAPLETAPALAERRVLRTFDELERLDWARSPESTAAAPGLGLRPGEALRATLELEPFEELPTRVLLGAVVPVPTLARIALFAGEVRLVEAEALLRAGPGRTEGAFEVPGLRFRNEQPTRIELELERLPLGGRQPALVRPLDLAFELRDPRELLPAHGSSNFAGPRTLQRRSATLLPAGRLASLLAAPEQPAELRFSFCVPPDTRHPDDRPVLRVTRSAEGLTRVSEHPAASVESDEPWVSVALPLAEFAGREVELEFAWGDGVQRPFLGLVTEPLLVRAAAAPRVVVLVTSDTHRGDHFGSAPDSVEVSTPFLDALAAEGALFIDARSSANSTNPSHASLMTGVTPATTGILDNDTPLAEVAPTLAEAFQEAGYFTVAAVSAVHLGPFWSGLGQGFDRYSSPVQPQRDSSETLRELGAQLDGTDGLPLFVWFHSFDAHAPYTPPESFLAGYYPPDRDPRDPRAPYANLDLIPDFDRTITDPDYTEALYRAEVSYLDDQLRQLLDLPRLSGAIFGLTGDHGECLSLDPVPFHHQGLSPSTLDVPLLLHGPGVPAGHVERGPAANQDLGRTLLDLAGLEDSAFPGASLLDFERLAPDLPRYAVDASGITASLERGPHLAVLTLSVPQGATDTTGTRAPRHGVALYDVRADPHLTRDLAADEPELTAELRAQLVAWLATAEPGSFVGSGLVSDDVATQLELLGYTAGAKRVAAEAWIDPDCGCPRCRSFR